jgi:hypothetical protein
MTPKIPVHLEADLKNLIKKIIPITPQIVRSQTLRSRFFRLGWCGSDKPSQPTEFIASDAAVVFWSFSTKGKGLAPAAMSGQIIIEIQISLLNPNPNKKMNLFLLKTKRNKSLFFPLRQPAQTNRTQKPKAHGLRFTER